MQHSLSHCRCTLPGSRALTFSPPSLPLPLFHHVIIGFTLFPSTPLFSSPFRLGRILFLLQAGISSRFLPPSLAPLVHGGAGGERNGDCVVRWMVVIPITPPMQRGSSKVQNNWQVPPATGRLSIPTCVCVCVCLALMRGGCQCCIQRSFH